MRNPRANLNVSKPVYVKWREHYSVGHDELDDHHRIIFSIINELFATIQEGADAPAIENILTRLVDYTKWHFACEEQLMELHGFPDISGHQEAHRRLIRDMDELRFQNLKPGALTASDLLRFLKRWWLEHICKTDRQYMSSLGEPAVVSSRTVSVVDMA